MSKLKTYEIPHVTIKGKTDLLDTYAWHGNSQGDESSTNDVAQGIASNGNGLLVVMMKLLYLMRKT